jgi:molybdate transport system permease protein
MIALGNRAGGPVAEARDDLERRVLRGARDAGQPLGFAVLAPALLLLVFLALPVIALVWRAGPNLRGPEAATRETLRQALVVSGITSSISLLAVIALGTPLAFLLARRRVRGVRLIETLVDLPMVLPPAVAGIALLMAFGRRGIAGSLLNDAGITIGFTMVAVILAQTFVSVPFFVRAARAGFQRVDRDLEESAADLGAGRWQVFRSVTLPLARAALGAGAVMAWARALGEFGATIMFAGNLAGETQTMPLAIYGRYEAGDLDTALVLALILLAISVIVLLGARTIGGVRAGE